MDLMRHRLPQILLVGLFALLALTTMTPLQAEPSVAGHVIIAKGEVLASQADGRPRKLRRRSPFFAGDILMTGAGAMAQLRFEDGAMVALKANTEFRVDRYRYEAEGAEGGESISTLLKGGFRTITGAIGKQDPESYRVTTPVATIGVRGTHFEIELVSGDMLLAVWDGAIDVTVDAGEARQTLPFGEGADFNFARVDARTRAVTKLLVPPEEFTGVDSVDGESAQGEDAGQGEAEEEDASQEEVEESSQDDGQAGSAGSEDQSDAESTDTETATGEDSGTETLDGDQSTDSTTDDTATLDDGTSDTGTFDDTADTFDATAESDTSLSTTTTTVTTDTTVDTTFTTTEPVTDLSDISSGDARLSDTEWASVTTSGYVAMAITTGPGSDGIRGGRSTSPDLGPVITDVGSETDVFANPETTSIVEVWRQGTAPVGPTTAPANPYGVDWGVWNGSATDPVVVQLDANDPTSRKFITEPVFWAAAIPALETDVATRTGAVIYDNLLGITGGGSGGMITAGNVLETEMIIDFDTGAVTGILDMSFQLGASRYQTWTLDYDGQLRGGNFVDVQITTGDVSDLDPSIIGTVPETDHHLYTTYQHNVDGSIGGVLVGSKGKGYAGGFDLESMQDPNIHVEGLILLDCANDSRC